MNFRADLHAHTTCSDGSLSPIQLIDLAKEVGLKAVSITDHDTLAAYTEEIREYAKKLSIIILTGVEFSCNFEGENIHVLGYGVDTQNEKIQQFCKRHQLRRMERNREILKKLTDGGMPITEAELVNGFSAKALGRPHIASLMIKKGYIKDIKEAFAHFIGDECPYYYPGVKFSIEETIKIIHEAGGKAFVAHPHLYSKESIVRKALVLPFDGIECYYAKIHYKREQTWLNLARCKNLLISGGSDFHGDPKPHIQLGSSWVDEATFQKIVN